MAIVGIDLGTTSSAMETEFLKSKLLVMMFYGFF